MSASGPKDSSGAKSLAAAVLAQAWEELVTGKMSDTPSSVGDGARARLRAGWRSYLSALYALIGKDIRWRAMLSLDDEALLERVKRVLYQKFGPEHMRFLLTCNEGAECPPWFADMRYVECPVELENLFRKKRAEEEREKQRAKHSAKKTTTRHHTVSEQEAN